MSDMTPEEIEKKLENLRPPAPAALDERIGRLLRDTAAAEPRGRIRRFVPYGLIAAGILLGVALALLIQFGQRRVRLLSEVSIRVSEIRGTVLVKHAGAAAWEEVGAASRLRLGDQFWSGSASSIVLTLKDHSLVTLGPGGALALTDDDGRVEFELAHGTMQALLRDGHPPFFVRTPQGLLESLGTEFAVSVE